MTSISEVIVPFATGKTESNEQERSFIQILRDSCCAEAMTDSLSLREIRENRIFAAFFIFSGKMVYGKKSIVTL